MKTKSRLLSFLTILVLLLACLHTATAQQHVEVGYVEAIHGPYSAFQLIRGGTSVAVKIMTPLVEQDEIKILEESSGISPSDKYFIVLNFNNVQPHRKLMHSDTQDRPFVVRRGGESARLPTKLMRIFEKIRDDRVVVTAIQSGTRSVANALLIPVLDVQGTRMVAGKRSVHLAWRGGKAPYQVTVRRDRDRALIFQANAGDGTRLVIPALDFSPGLYRMEVTAANGKVVLAQFEAVDVRLLPGLPADLAFELREARLPEAARETLVAAWLMGQEGGRWWFEAYQKAAPIADSYSPAKYLKEWLEDGF